MLYQVFAKINDIISSFRGNTFTKQEITSFCNKLYDTLIQADVPYDYTQQFIGYIRNKLMKMKNKNLNKQMVVGGIIRSYIENTFRQANGNGIHIKDNVVNVIGVYGPNGVGKTSFVAKLAKLFQKKFNKKILCVSFDTTRTSANKQLQILCNSNDIAYINVVEHNIDDGLNKIRQIVKYKMVDILLIDNAGISPDDRDGILIWKNVSDVVDFDEKIVVLDATYGQNASHLINAYVKIIHPTGFAVSKSDSDHKGGVFFAIATSSDKPIYYVLNGEKIDNIYEFKTSMILDAIKGALPVVLAYFLTASLKEIGLLPVIAAVFVIIGHSKSVFLKFTGGKSVASGVGTLLALNWQVGLIIAAIWAIITWVSRYVSLGSIIALAAAPIVMWFLNAPISYIIYAAVAAIYVIYLHRENIKRLIAGNENKVR